ncbi:MAG: (Fe-S)-binding protein [Candidatus Thorarchaeota archaeon]|nr:(Fe-S)-binding protein [Candidatus Thorarchaeota archaeon]
MEISKYKDQIWQCGRCGYCGGGFPEDRCPSKFLGKFESSAARGKLLIARALMRGDMQPTEELANRLYECTLCGSCEIICDTIIHLDLVEILEALRVDIAEAGFGPMPRHQKILDWIEVEHNPYMEKHADRLNWMTERGRHAEHSDVLYFAGCTAPYRQPEIAESSMQIMEAAGVKAFVAPEEWCCGSIAFRVGANKMGEKLARHNVDLFKSLRVKTIVTHCPGCYRTMKIDYPRILGDMPIEVFHFSEYLDELLNKGTLKLKGRIDAKVTYHDPCHLGKHAGVYDAPRRVLEAIPGLKLVEMERTRQDSWCCGAGGGMKSAFPDSAVKVANERIVEAEKTGAEYLVSTCPFCKQNLKEASELRGEGLEVFDMMELLSKVL